MITRRHRNPARLFEINHASPQAQGLIGWWTFSDASGLLVPDHVRGNNGIPNVGLSQYANGDFGMGLQLSGSSQYVLLSSSSSPPMSVGGMSIASLSAWFLPLAVPATNTYPCVYYESTSTTGYTRFGLVYYPDGTMHGTAAQTTTGTITVTGPVLTLGTIYKIDLTYNSDTDQQILYVNGVEYARNSASKGPIYSGPNVDSTVMGMWGTSYINGVIFDVRLRDIEMPPGLVWHEYDPRTRWDLYRPRQRYWTGSPVAAELEDVSLDLSAYYQSLEDFGTILRAHDGLELDDLRSLMEAAGWDLTDFGLTLDAFLVSLEDLGMDLGTWASALSDMIMDLRTHGFDLDDLSMLLRAAAHGYVDLPMALEAASPTVLLDLAVALWAVSGEVMEDLGIDLRAIIAAPVFRSSTAQRLSSVITEIV